MLDINIPRVDGMTVLKKVKQIFKTYNAQQSNDVDVEQG